MILIYVSHMNALLLIYEYILLFQPFYSVFTLDIVITLINCDYFWQRQYFQLIRGVKTRQF